MTAEIIGVGSELLLGQIVNTDAQYISLKLSELGIPLYYQTVVGDNEERLLKAFEIAASRADTIITTGGLGPTMDDLTKETAAKFLGKELKPHAPSLERLNRRFQGMGAKPTQNNYKQILFPEDCIVLTNNNGTAPGAIMEARGICIIILPGPPFELEPMFDESVMPYLMGKTGNKLTSKVLNIIGVGESAVEDRLMELLKNQSNPTIAPLAKMNEVTLRITALTRLDEDAEELIAPVEKIIRDTLGTAIYGINDESVESVLVELLKKRKKTVATAESCTGGLAADMLTDVSGASEVFREGFVTYSDEAKAKYLGVSAATLKNYGAVSKETALEMAEGLLRASGADYVLSITGISGPTGGTPEKPVGLCYAGYGRQGDIQVAELHSVGSRNKIKQASAKKALNLLRLYLLENE